MTDSYYRTDTEHDAAWSIVAASEFFGRVREHSHYWRWSVLALHSALQGALALSLTNGNTVLVQKPGVSRRMLAALSGEGNFPEPYMDNFLALYRKAGDRANLPAGSIPVPDIETHHKAMASLDELRDGFIHFNSKSWAIEKSLIIETSTTCCVVLRHLHTTGGAIRWHDEECAATAGDALGALELALREAG